MIVDLAEIEGASRPFNFEVTADELDLADADLTFKDGFQASGEIIKTAAEVKVTGSISGEAAIDCSRCLLPVERKLSFEFEANFVTPENFAADKEREVSVEDLDTDVLDSDRIDLKDVVREQLLLNSPEQVFCSADCKGLCPKCGTNRNLIDCKCDLNESDPRWAALKDFR